MPNADDDFHTQRMGAGRMLTRGVKGGALLIRLPALLVF